MYMPFEYYIFKIISLAFPILFTFIFAMIVLFAVRGFVSWNRDNNSPMLVVNAKVISKRTAISRHNNGDFDDMSYTKCYATFEVEGGERIEFGLSGKEYGLLLENDSGKLTFQGKRYKAFNRNV